MEENMSFMSKLKNNNVLKVGIALLIVIIIIILLLLLNRKVPTYNITFDTNGGSPIESIVVEENSTITKPEDPTRENYKFAGWYYNDELYDFSTPVTSDMTLEARWVDLGLGKVSGVSLNATELTLYVNDTYKLTATIMPLDANDKSVTWESSAPEIVSVDAEGNIKALKEGTATIIVKTNDGGYTATIQIVVKIVETDNNEDNQNDNSGNTNNGNNNSGNNKPTIVNVTGVSLNKTSLTLTEGDTSKLTATITPSNATNKNVTWASSNPDVVSVDSNGNIKALKAGSATITVTTADGNYKATCQVTVNEKPASYSVIFTPIVQEGTNAVVQYTVAVTKNNSSFTGYKFINYNGTVVKNTLSSAAYNKNITSATIRLDDRTDVTATVVYK